MMEQNKRQTPSIIQIVPPEWCFKCDVCCRFPESTSFLAPYFTAKEIALTVEAGVSVSNFHNKTGCKITLTPGGEAYICPAFDLQTAHCLIYNVRPFDCELYPYAIMQDETGKNVVLGLDTKCPYVRENMGTDLFTSVARDIVNAIESSPLNEIITENKDLIGPFQDDVITLIVLKKLSECI